MTAPSAVLRFSRDKRGYGHFYLVESATSGGSRTRTRLLYCFRTPPGVRVGRTPFDEETRRAVEAQNPGVRFDWTRILATPIPPPAPDVEQWRLRRRSDRAARRDEQAVRTEGAEPNVQEEQEPVAPDANGEDSLSTSPRVARRDGKLEPPQRRRGRRRGRSGGRSSGRSVGAAASPALDELAASPASDGTNPDES